MTFQLSRRAFVAGTLVAGAAALVAGPALAEKRNLGHDNLAIEGYDPVAYFTDSKAVAGDKAITAEHGGAVYRFASAANRDAFLASPAKYVPQYGGFCAYAVSQGYTAAVDPTAFSVVDGKLYLNYSKRVRDLWSKDVPGFIAAADSNWPGLSAN